MRDLTPRRLMYFLISLVVLAIPAVVAALTMATGGCGKMCGL
jgi:hypothetical protein